MRSFIAVSLLILGALFTSSFSLAQTAGNTPVYRVGIFAPLYLDSVFNSSGQFRYSNSIPKFIAPAVDFINGVQVGIDSLPDGEGKVEVRIYDTKSYTQPLSVLVKSRRLDSIDLLISPVKDMEYRLLADYALKRNIPFISVAYPNDGGVTGNPFVVILNSTLRAHCEAIFSFVLQNHGTDKILLCRKKGQQEDRVASYIKAINEQDGKPLVNIQTVYFDSTISSELLAKKLDSTRGNILIGGSLDEQFAFGLSHACDELDEKYPITLIGMPNWDGFKSLNRKGEFEDFPIYFTTPYFNSKNDAYSRMLIEGYKKKWKGYPSDMAFKGFEAAQVFIRMLTEYPGSFMSQLNNPRFRLFTEYNFKPVNIRSSSTVPDYFENKHLYFVKILNGVASKAW